MKLQNDYYVISEDFKLVSFNKPVEERYKGIKIGDFCYKATMNRDSPCLHCPIAGNGTSECPIYFDPFYNCWVQANFSELPDGNFSVICHPAEQVGMELLEKEEKEQIKNTVLGKAANDEFYIKLKEQSSIIEGFKGIFFATYIIDLKQKTYRQVFMKDKTSKIYSKLEGLAENAFKYMEEDFVAPETRAAMTQFNDLKTIAERLGTDKGIITQDFISVSDGWCRANIIPIERDENGFATKIIYGTSRNSEDLTDSLTGCYNRKALSWTYDNHYKSEDSIAVILCDLNGLKQINDTEGHEAGDRYICKAAYMLEEFFGRNNVYRFGGDEFIVVVIGALQDVVGRRVMAFKKECENQNLMASFGYEFRSKFDVPFEEILKEADEKMYQAKREYYKKRGIDRRSTSIMDRNKEYFDSLIEFGSSCYLVCRIDILKNTYKIIHIMEGYDSSFISECKTLRDIFYYPCKKKVIHADDQEDYIRWIENSFLNPEPEKLLGKSESWIRYRSCYNKSNFRLTEVNYFPGRHYSPDNQYGYIYLKDKGNVYEEGRMIFDEVLKNLSENFESVFYIDFDSNKIIPYRINKFVTDQYVLDYLKKNDYKSAISEYINTNVADSDKEEMRFIFRKKFLQDQLRVKRAFSRDYVAVIDGNEVYYRVKFSNMDGPGELHNCAIGFANINAEMIYKQEFKIQGKSILVVEDSDVERKLLAGILRGNYKVIEAENGLKAKEYLLSNYKDVSIVITDLQMPGMDGESLLSLMQVNPFFKNIPVVITTGYGEEERKIRCLENGATDYISKPYNRKIIINRIESILKLQGLSQRSRINEIDHLTGLYNKEAFFRYVQNIIDSNPGTEYVLILSSITGLKAINEQHGKSMGDKILKYIAQAGVYNTNDLFIGGRISSDTFACLMPEKELELQNEQNIIQSVVDNAPIPNLILKYGFYYTKDGRDISAQQMCDRAELALRSIIDDYNVISARYVDSMRNKILVEQQILESMETALKEEQFQVYFQPKHDIEHTTLAGAEALVRWIHPTMGFMNPADFIPLFEKNGFISKLDRYIWRKTCEEIAYWIEQEKYFPISINVSRKDFADPELADYLLNLTAEYKIPHELLHIEVTESAYSDNPEQLKATVGLLHSKGFIIELDDFGTGYSSLTAINSFEIDILKLDMSIIRSDSNNTGKSVLEFSMELAKMMNVKTIQEGVETEDQFNRIKSLGCNYVQGYYFSKPLSKKDFDEYVRNMQK